MPEAAPSTPPAATPTLPDPGLVIGSSPTISEPQKLWAEERARIVSGDVWQQSPEKVALVKDASGKVSAVPRNGADGASDQQPKPSDQQQPQQQPRTDGGKILLAEGIEVSEQELRDLVSFKASEDSRKLTAPQKAEDFRLELPADLKMPQGVDFRIDPNNPAIEPARQFALRNNLSQQQFSEMLGVYAATQASEMVAFNAAKAAEVQKLGDAANARVDAVRTWLKATVPEHFNDLARVLDLAPTAATVRGLEALMHKLVTQGGASFNGAHREPTIPGKISDAEYGKLSYAERIAYAARFPQPGG
jgi:hypothetical protein